MLNDILHLMLTLNTEHKAVPWMNKSYIIYKKILAFSFKNKPYSLWNKLAGLLKHTIY